MKNLNWIERLLFLINMFLAALLLISYALPFVFLKSLPQLSVLSIFLPLLMILNFLFLVFWVFRWKHPFLLSLLLLVIGYGYIGRFVQFSSSATTAKETDIKVMSFNVRLFNHYHWINDPKIPQKIKEFIAQKSPDILLLQEYYIHPNYQIKEYPYKYIANKRSSDKIGQAIFSKFPILNKGSLDFPRTGNNGIFADLLVQKDTIRVYNLHFESMHIDPDKQEFSQKNSWKLIKNIGRRFAIQQKQVEIYKKHYQQSSYKKIVGGDFNNTAFSYLYQQIKADDLQDSFVKAGKRFGRTLDFKYFPFRIDYLLIDTSFEVVSHQNFKEQYSDHYPIMASFRIK